MPILIETFTDNEVEWGLSFSDHNPTKDKYFKCNNKDEALKLIILIESIK